MTQKTRRLCLAAAAAALLGTGVVRADLGPFPRHRDRPLLAPCSVLPIRSVEKVRVAIVPSPRVVAKGTTTTAGWTEPALRFVEETGAGTPRRTRVYEFVACRPTIAAQVLSPITAEVELPQTWDGPWHGRILVKAERNSRTFDPSAMPGR
jgi:hypothetical protein